MHVTLISRFDGIGTFDLLDKAAAAVRSPRSAMKLSLNEITALAFTVLDLWEIALTGEALADRLITGEPDGTLPAIAHAILDEMAALRGTTAEA
jgi:hypothetical protein